MRGASSSDAPSAASVDSALVQRVRGGDAEAFDTLVRACMRQAYAVAYRVLRHHEDAEDMVQEVFASLLGRLERFDASRPFAPWFLRVVANLAKSQARKRATRTAASLEWEGAAVPDLRADPERDAQSAALRDAFGDALRQLSARQRLVVQLVDVDGFTPTEVAGMLDIAPGTVRAYLYEARQILRCALVTFHGEGQ